MEIKFDPAFEWWFIELPNDAMLPEVERWCDHTIEWVADAARLYASLDDLILFKLRWECIWQQRFVDAGAFYCPYIPLQMTRPVAPFPIIKFRTRLMEYR